MSSQVISVTEAQPQNFAAPSPPKTPKSAAEKGLDYTRTYLKYNYGTQEEPYWDDPIFELKPCTGIIKRNEKGAIKLNLLIEDKDDLTGLKRIDTAIPYCIDAHKDAFNLGEFNPQYASGIRGCTFIPKDKKTNVPARDAIPLMSLKHDTQTKFKYYEILKNPDGTVTYDDEGLPTEYKEIIVPIEKLVGQRITCSVFVCVRDLYHGGGLPIVQLFVRSCVILSAEVATEVDHTQSQAVRHFLSTTVDDSLGSTMSKLMEQQESILTAPPAAPEQKPQQYTAPPQQQQYSVPPQQQYSAPPQQQYSAPPQQQQYSMAPQQQYSSPPTFAPQPSPAPTSYTVPPTGQQQYSYTAPMTMPQMPSPSTMQGGDLSAFLQQQASAQQGFIATKL